MVFSLNEHVADVVVLALLGRSKSLLALTVEVRNPKSVRACDVDYRVVGIPSRQLVIRRRLAGHESHIDNERESPCYQALSLIFVGLDEVDDGSVSGVGAHEEDVCWIIELDVVFPQVSEKLSRFAHSIFHGGVLFVLLLIRLEFGDVFRKVDIDDCKALLGSPVDVGLHNISLSSR